MRENMMDEFLVPAGTAVSDKGDGAAFDIGPAGSRAFLVTLQVSEAVEQEAIELSLFGSSDGTNWDSKPFVTLPQRFYAGEYPSLVDLSLNPGIRFLRVHWEVNRWGRGSQTPRFVFSVRLLEIARELLNEN